MYLSAPGRYNVESTSCAGVEEVSANKDPSFRIVIFSYKFSKIYGFPYIRLINIEGRKAVIDQPYLDSIFYTLTVVSAYFQPSLGQNVIHLSGIKALKDVELDHLIATPNG